MMKRIAVLCLVLALLAALASCSSSPKQPTTTQPAEAPTELPFPDSKPIPAAEAFAGGSGTEADPYRIESAQQLALLAKYVNEQNKDFNQAWYVQTADIVMNDISNVENWATEAPEWCWTPIGSKFLVDFLGHYDGNGHSISGMYIFSSRPANSEGPGDHVGLFGSVYQGSVKNVILKDSYVFANNQSAAAGIVGEAKYSQISNCVNEATVETRKTHNVGGICGDAFIETNIRDCTNTGVICDYESPTNERPAVGGICGHSYTVSDCTNEGNITGAGSVGGICGNTLCEITGCSNSGNIDSLDSAGGIVAGGGTLIKGCQNSGNVSAGTPEKGCGGVGGIAASTLGSIADCTNDGAVLANDGTVAPAVGGIVGGFYGNFMENPPSSITNCINNGTVTALGDGNWCGGIIGTVSTGDDSTSITGCINYGKIHTTNGEAGGISGRAFAANELTVSFTDCFNHGIISSGTDLSDYAGGICGYMHMEEEGTIRLDKCTNEADLNSATCAGICPAVITIGSGVLECIECVNTGNITTQGSRVGGMFRLISGKADVLFDKCRNEGTVLTTDGTMFAGGLVGHLDGINIQILNCTNKGALTIENGLSVLAGGLMGSPVGYETIRVDNCSNHGNITILSDNSVSEEDYRDHPDWYYLLIGGITSASKNADCYTNCTNTGILSVEGNGACIGRTSDIMAIILSDQEQES